LANNPPALHAFMAMSRYVRDDSSLPDSLRELAVLTVAHALKSEYELHQHSPIARRLGITEVQLRELPNWRKSTNFSAVQRAVIAFASEATTKRRVSDASFAEVADHLWRSLSAGTTYATFSSIRSRSKSSQPSELSS